MAWTRKLLAKNIENDFFFFLKMTSNARCADAGKSDFPSMSPDAKNDDEDDANEDGDANNCCTS